MDIQLLACQFYDYSLHMRGYSKDTIKRYRQIINFYCRFTGIEKLNEVTEENIRVFFFNGRTQRNWKPNTFITFHKSLLVFFRWCVDQHHMQRNPVENIELPK